MLGISHHTAGQTAVTVRTPAMKRKTKVKTKICLKVTAVFPRPLAGKRVARMTSPVHPEWLRIPPSAREIPSPHQYFERLHSNDISELLVTESNLYSIQRNPDKPLDLTVQELEQLHVFLLHYLVLRLGACSGATVDALHVLLS